MHNPRRWLSRVGLPALALLVLWGCQQNERPPATDCALGNGGDCGVNPGVGVGQATSSGTSGTGGDGTGGASVEVDVTGTVAVIDVNTFDHAFEYAKKATIVAPSPTGTVTGVYEGLGQPFGLKGASSGVQWLRVDDDSMGASGILSTYSAHDVQQGSALVLPVMDRQVLQSILFTQPGSPSLAGAAAQIILLVRRQGVPAEDVNLTSSNFGGVVAYDVSAGVYSSEGAKKTGKSGVILMLNVTVTKEEIDILLTDSAAETFAITLPIAGGKATIAELNL